MLVLAAQLVGQQGQPLVPVLPDGGEVHHRLPHLFKGLLQAVGRKILLPVLQVLFVHLHGVGHLHRLAVHLIGLPGGVHRPLGRHDEGFPVLGPHQQPGDLVEHGVLEVDGFPVLPLLPLPVQEALEEQVHPLLYGGADVLLQPGEVLLGHLVLLRVGPLLGHGLDHLPRLRVVEGQGQVLLHAGLHRPAAQVVVLLPLPVQAQVGQHCVPQGLGIGPPDGRVRLQITGAHGRFCFTIIEVVHYTALIVPARRAIYRPLVPVLHLLDQLSHLLLIGVPAVGGDKQLDVGPGEDHGIQKLHEGRPVQSGGDGVQILLDRSQDLAVIAYRFILDLRLHIHHRRHKPD